MKTTKGIFLLIFYLFSFNLFSQDNVGIGTTTPNPGAILELFSSDQGILLPRIALASDTTTYPALSVEGMLFYASDANVLLYYDGSNWNPIAVGEPNYWRATGSDIYNINTGGVAIGATSTALSFQVVQSLASSNPVMGIENQNSSGDVSYGMMNSGSGTSYTLGVDASDANKFKISNSSILGTNDRISINSAGGVGIATNNPINTLDVEGGVAIGPSYSGNVVGPATGLIVEGNVGIGSTNPGVSLEIGGTASQISLGLANSGPHGIGFGDNGGNGMQLLYRTGNNHLVIENNSDFSNATDLVVFENNGSVGIGVSNPVNLLDVEGGVAIGSAYSGTNTAPLNGLIVESQIGVGTPTPAISYGLHIHNGSTSSLGKFSTAATGFGVNDGVSIGYVDAFGAVIMVTENAGIRVGTNSSYHSFVSSTGNWGLGTLTPANRLDVEGGAAIGATYSGVNTAPANGAIIEGQVGIGTPSPVYDLTLGGTGAVFGVENTASFMAKNSVGTYETWLWPRWSDNVMYMDYGAGGFDIRNNGGTRAMFMTNTANVGIGTSGAVNKLDVEGGVAIGASFSGTSIAPTNGMIIQGNTAIGRRTANVQYWSPLNSGTSPTVLTISGADTYADNSPGILEIHGSSANISDEIGVINFTSLDPSGVNHYNFARISAHRENSNSTYASLRFFTRKGATMSEVMHIDEDQRVGIGESFPNSKLHIDARLGETAFRVQVLGSSDLVVQADGTVTVNTPTDQAYDFYVSGSAAKTSGTAWINTSDKRLKEIVGTYEDGLNIIRKINPVWFKYNGKGGIEASDHAQVGIIAQDLQEIAPYTVSTFSAKVDFNDKKETELLNFDFNAINYAQINAIKELADEVDQLKSENINLRSELLQLKVQFQKIIDIKDLEVRNSE